jgi:cyanoexosortase A
MGEGLGVRATARNCKSVNSHSSANLRSNRLPLMYFLRYRLRLILNDSNAWLLGVAIALIALHSLMYWRFTGNFNHISVELIGWSAVFYSLWQRRKQIVLRRERGAQFLGWFLIALLLVRGINLSSASGSVLSLNSLAIGIAMAAIAVGFKQFKDYQREFWLIAMIALPLEQTFAVVDHFVNSSVLTAKYAHTLMWYCGFLVHRQGTLLALPTGTVNVYPGCSGLEAILISLKVGFFFLVVYPTRLREKFLVPAIAILSAFIINGFRIMLLAHLVANQDTAGFEYWHGDQGAQIFSMISMTIFSSYCQVLIDQKHSDNSELEESPEPVEHSSR